MYQVIFNTHDVVLLMTAYQCILFAILLLTIKREKAISNIFLALFLLQQAAIPLDILISFGAEFRHIALSWSPNLFYVFGFGYWLEAPFLLWYTRSLIYKDYRLTKMDAIYLIPFLCYLVHQILFYYRLEWSDKLHIQQAYNLFLAPHYMNYVTLFRELFRAALGVMCIIEIRRYSQHIKTNFSDIERLDLTWLKMLSIGFLIIRGWAVLVGLLILLSVSFGISTNFEVMGLLGNYTTFVMVSILIFFGLGHSSVFEGMEARHSSAGRNELPKDRIKDEQIKSLTDFMEQQKPYLVPALTLDKLATQLKMQPRVLSHLINRHFDCNFFEFINAYRVDEAKRLLNDPANEARNMLAVMYDVGFNSKATFNTLFKKKVGMTPTEYRKQALLRQQQDNTGL
ncbi:helix-turn-helix domain-containing protein [Cellvibrio sp.]|uniref:helix-turn-helix domain-containing protein n=1 Tax=Cellvibrio sp. TaxID=1965322 RepID=UPI0039647A21